MTYIRDISNDLVYNSETEQYEPAAITFSFIIHGSDSSTESIVSGNGTSFSIFYTWNDDSNGWYVECNLSSDTTSLLIKTSGFNDYTINDFSITDITLIPSTYMPTRLYCYECEPISKVVYIDNKNPQVNQNIYNENGKWDNGYIASIVNNTISINRFNILWRYGDVYLPKNPVTSDTIYIKNTSGNIEVTTKYTITSIEPDYTSVTLFNTEDEMNYTFYRNSPYEYTILQ